MHAYDIAKDELVSAEYDCVVTVSGDGLIHEVVNGVMQRTDRDEFLKHTTFGFIPAGTANGLIASILKQHEEDFGIHNAAFLIAKGNRTKMDLTELTMEYQPDTKLYMFLSLAWAIIADCDINSEVIRCVGPPRFTLWGIYRLLNLRNYFGSLQFKGQTLKSNRQHEIEEITNF